MDLKNTKQFKDNVLCKFSDLPKYYDRFSETFQIDSSIDVLSNSMYKKLNVKELKNNLVIKDSWINTKPMSPIINHVYTPCITVSEGAVMHRDNTVWGDRNLKLFQITDDECKLYKQFFQADSGFGDVAMATSRGITGINFNSKPKKLYDVLYVSDNPSGENTFESITHFIDIAPYSNISLFESFYSDISTKVFKIVYIVREGATLNIKRSQRVNDKKTYKTITSDIIQHPRSKLIIDVENDNSNLSFLHEEFHVNCMQETYTVINSVGYIKNNNTNSTLIDVKHTGPNSFSRVNVKTAVDDQANFNFIGNIKINKEAIGTDSVLVNKNLQLSEKAKIITEPRLDIATKEIKCSHGCTISNISEEEIYFLGTRGIARDDAEDIIVNCFLGLDYA